MAGTRMRKTRAARRKRTAKKAAPGPRVLVVNMVPRSLSGETNQDSEPTIAVNPANPLQIVGTAFTPDPMGGAFAPVYVSTDGGNSWQLNSIVPSNTGSGLGTGDISAAFASSGGALYAGILRDPTFNFEALRTTSFANPAPMTILGDRPQNDQPFTHAISNAGRDRVYIGNNDFQAVPRTATIDVSADGRAAQPAFQKVRIEVRQTAGQNGPQVRPVAHPDGTAYAVFYGWRSQSGSFPGNTLVVTTDVIVVRDDHGGIGTNAFTDLKEPSDNLAGRIVARGVRIPFQRNGIAATGQQRIGGTISISVDPRAGKSGTVYVVWGEQPAQQNLLTLHLRRSINRGATWSATDLLTVTNATNAALAVNSKGVVGFLYQQLTGSGASQRWVTHFQRGANGQNWTDIVLATTPATMPVKSFDPYLGDYDHLVAVGKDFFGIFSANNTPDLANFPAGVSYQRNSDFTTHRLLAVNNTTPVAVSIDPFFFRVAG